MNSPYAGTPWRAVFTKRDAWSVWTKRDKTLGSRNNYAVAIGIQDENEAALLAAAPELVEALRAMMQFIGEPDQQAELTNSSVPLCRDAIESARALLAKLEGGEA